MIFSCIKKYVNKLLPGIREEFSIKMDETLHTSTTDYNAYSDQMSELNKNALSINILAKGQPDQLGKDFLRLLAEQTYVG